MDQPERLPQLTVLRGEQPPGGAEQAVDPQERRAGAATGHAAIDQVTSSAAARLAAAGYAVSMTKIYVTEAQITARVRGPGKRRGQARSTAMRGRRAAVLPRAPR